MRPLRLLTLLCSALALAACSHGDSRIPRIERLALSPSAPVALPSAWAAAYRSWLDTIAGEGGAIVEAAGPEAAAAAVRDGRARYAVTTPDTAGGLATAEIDGVPLALTVPLTFAVEDVTGTQARDLLAGRMTGWQAAGGPSVPVSVDATAVAADAGIVARALREGPVSTVVRGGAGAVTLRIEAWPGGSVERKPLRVGGALPGEPGYPFVDQRVVAGRPADREAVTALADTLRRAAEARRSAVVTLDAVGDLMLGRGVGRLIAEHGPGYPFAAVQPLFAGADVRFGNLELPLTERGTAARKDYVFRAPPSAISGVAEAGFSVLSLANNHALDYGPEGLVDTIDALDGAGIARAGAGRTAEEAHAPAILTVKGLRLAFLAYVNVPNDSTSGFVAEETAATSGRPGVAWGTAEAVRRDVAAVKRQADLVIVSIHSGFEYTASPNAVQRDLAHAAIDAGAALVLGGHPHVLQGTEIYRGAPIIYSLGNFVFDLDDDDRRQPGLPSVLTVVCRVTLTAQGVTGVRFLPAIIDAREGRPIPATGADARRVLDRVYRLTDALK